MSEARKISAFVCGLGGWLIVAAVNAVYIALQRLPAGGFAVRAAHHFHDAGQLLAAGIVSGALAAGFARWGPDGRRASVGMVTAGGVVLGLFALPEDLIGLSLRLFGSRAGPVVWLLSGVCALVIPGAMAMGMLVRRPKWRWAAVIVAAGGAVANNLLLPGDYRGIHLVISFASATLGGSALYGARWPVIVSRLGRTGTRTVLALVVALALAAVVIQPSHRVRVQLFRIDGATIALPVARAHSWVRGPSDPTITTQPKSQWNVSREGAPDVPPSELGLIGPDAIVVMITMDSVRAELFTDERYASRLPRLRALAAESVYFSQARSIGSGTVVSFSQIATGKHAFQLAWSKGNSIKSDRSVRFPELLHRAGVTTVTFANYKPLFPSRGMFRGFAEATFIKPKTEGQKYALAATTVDPLIERIRSHGGGRMFLFAHLIDPHSPYDAAGKKETPFESYLAEVELCGVAIERVIAALKERDLWHRTVFISGSDHGEGFNDHKGLPFHNNGLYEEIVHVPMFIRIPGVDGRALDAMVSSLDLAPTILDLFGLPTPGSYMGQSLLPLIAGADVELTRPVLAHTLKHVKKIAYYQPPFKLIVSERTNTLEVYDLSSDPDERHNLADEHSDRLMGELAALRKAHARR